MTSFSKLKLVLAAAFGLLLAACSSAPEALPGTLDAQTVGSVCFYEHANFEGRSFCADKSQARVALMDNDIVSSVKVKPGVQVTLFEHGGSRGRTLELTENAATIPANFNDITSSFRITKGESTPTSSPLKDAAACFYVRDNLRGSSFCKAEGDESVKQLKRFNNRISSVKVAPGYEVVLYPKFDFKGRSLTLRESANLGNSKNRVSSIEVRPVDAEPEVNESILELAATNEDLSTLASAVQQAGLADALAEDVEGGLTVFAPTDDAFRALDALPEGDALKEVLTYHVAAGALSAAQLADKDSVETLSGDDISVEVVDGDVVLNGTVKVVQADVQASNGMVHVIDAVLLPENESEPEPQPEPEPTLDPEPTPSGNSAQAQVLSLVNEARRSGYNCFEGYFGPTDPLELNSRLNAVAQVQADHLAGGAFFNHFGPGNNTIGDRVNAEGYEWSGIAENIAAGQRTPEEALESWLTSKTGHCGSIMNPDMEELGVGVADGASIGDNGQRYEGLQWVQVFGNPR